MNCFSAIKKCLVRIFYTFKKSKTETNNHLFYRCEDSPYGLISFEILIRIRNSIEATKEPVEKHYYRFLEKYIIILDMLNQENGEILLCNYYKSLEKALALESNSKYSYLITMTIQTMKCGLKLIDFSNQMNIKKLQDQIIELQQRIRQFRMKNKECKLINQYCKILHVLPSLTLVRRGLQNRINYDDD